MSINYIMLYLQSPVLAFINYGLKAPGAQKFEENALKRIFGLVFDVFHLDFCEELIR